MTFNTLGEATNVMRRDLRDPGYNARNPQQAGAIEVSRPYTGNPAIDDVLNTERLIANTTYAERIQTRNERRNAILKKVGKYAGIAAAVSAALVFAPDVISGIAQGKSPGDSIGRTLGSLFGGHEHKAVTAAVGAVAPGVAAGVGAPAGGEIDAAAGGAGGGGAPADALKAIVTKVKEIPSVIGGRLFDVANDRHRVIGSEMVPGDSVPHVIYQKVKGGPIYNLSESFAKNTGVDNPDKWARSVVHAIANPITSLFGRGASATTGYEAAGSWRFIPEAAVALYAGNKLKVLDRSKRAYRTAKFYATPTRDLRKIEQRGLRQEVEKRTFAGNVAGPHGANDAQTAIDNIDRRVDYIKDNSRLLTKYP